MPLRERLVVGDKLLKNGVLYTISSVDGSLFIYNSLSPRDSIKAFRNHVKYIKEIPDNELETYTIVKVYNDLEAEISTEIKGSTDG